VRAIPKISIVIPFYNAISTIGLCLESTQQLNYPREKLEIIVVDNGSDDGSDAIAKKFDVKAYNETSLRSSYQARNTGIMNASGELIAFTDSDCIVSPDWLINLIKDWDDISVGCFAGEILSYNPHTLVEKFSDRSGLLKQQWTLDCSYMPYTTTANSAYRKEVFDRVGLFNPRLFSGGDCDLSWRMQNETGLKIKFTPEAVVFHKHRTNIIDLYKQFKKYEYGQILLHKLYPNMPVSSVKQRKSELHNAVYAFIRWSPGNTIKYINKDIDAVTLMTPFFNIIKQLGTYSGRIYKTEGD
jgi:glycosyltransferase involved in cell wall biosynthesis